MRAARTTAEDFRGWLRELRQSAGLTQEQLASAIGTDRRNIRRWEVEGHDPSGTMLLRILAAVGATVQPSAPGEAPRPVNAALEALEARIAAAADDSARRHEELLARLDRHDAQLGAVSSRLEARS